MRTIGRINIGLSHRHVGRTGRQILAERGAGIVRTGRTHRVGVLPILRAVHRLDVVRARGGKTTATRGIGRTHVMVRTLGSIVP